VPETGKANIGVAVGPVGTSGVRPDGAKKGGTDVLEGGYNRKIRTCEVRTVEVVTFKVLNTATHVRICEVGVGEVDPSSPAESEDTLRSGIPGYSWVESSARKVRPRQIDAFKKEQLRVREVVTGEVRPRR